MQDTAPVTEPASDTEPELPPSRTFRRAFGDLRDGWRQRQLWGHLAFQDIKQGYRRSVIGPLWVTISMAVTAVALGILYSALFDVDIEFFLPYVATGLITWQIITGCVNEGAQVFIRNEGLIKHLPAPLSVHVYRMVYNQLLLFGHNIAVLIVLLAIYWPGINWHFLLVFPALALLMLNGVWFGFVIGIVGTRFRDIPPLTASIMNLLFFMTPIVWVYEDFVSKPETEDRAKLAQLNPFMHFIQIVRQPVLNQDVEPQHWVVVGGITIIGWALALLALRNYRARVSYWV